MTRWAYVNPYHYIIVEGDHYRVTLYYYILYLFLFDIKIKHRMLSNHKTVVIASLNLNLYG